MDESAATPPTLSDPGEALPFPSWDRYQVVSFLGVGGMGSVYEAKDPRLSRRVAIKFLRVSQLDKADTRQRRRFEREARAQARIEHPHICKIYEVGEVQGQPYLAMQLISGSALGALATLMTREQKARAIEQVAAALHAAHMQGLIHRDIKPSNIMVERRPDGTWWPYLTDFGLAREVNSTTQTITAAIEGTPAFMAPEQARGETRLLDRRTDVYGLGAALYAVLAGRPPFVGNATDVLLDVMFNEPAPLRRFDPAVPAALETIVLKCLEKEPQRRYESAKALADDLNRFLDGVRIAARPPGPLLRLGRFVQRHKLGTAILSTALVASLVLGGVALRARWQATEQARLAEHLGQEITKMEWLLRSARQLPLHDLDREKVIVRQRMQELQAELASYGQLTQGLAHYALGRGHMALHEYPQALTELQLAIQLGVQGAEVQYALGLVLGKHFEQAMYEARLSGGGNWVKKQLEELEPKYLTPALISLQRHRSVKLDAPQYLEGLIAYYQRDYDRALQQAKAAMYQAPWLYEANKLAGDVHLERALLLRDSGRYDEAEREFVEAVQSYQAAAAVGQSDAEVYEGLAETWVRIIEMTVKRGQPAELAYTAAVVASDKIRVAEPQSIAGPLKKAFAALMTMKLAGTRLSSQERVRQCLTAAEEVLQRVPGHPYASDVLADCTVSAVESAQERGEDPRPLLRKALGLLESTIKSYPHFLWGLSDLGNATSILGAYLQLHGDPSARQLLQQSIEHFSAAAALDPTFAEASSNALSSLQLLVLEARSEQEIQKVLAQADKLLATCQSINQQEWQCPNNYFQVYVRAALQALLAGHDPQPRLARARASLADTRRFAHGTLDTAQLAALAQLVQAGDQLRRKQNPNRAISELQAELTRCFAFAPQDAMCRTLDAQADLLQVDWLTSQNRPTAESLEAALGKALLAAKSPEIYPEAWQTVAELHLRMARAAQKQPRVFDQHVADGLAAVARVFAINPNHALGLATQAALQLLRAQAQQARK